jgi:hypothetical protein
MYLRDKPPKTVNNVLSALNVLLKQAVECSHRTAEFAESGT